MNKKGWLQATKIVAYIMLVVGVMGTAKSWYGENDMGLLAPLLAISVLSVSVLICALIVFAEPYRLFLDKKGKEALEIVIATTRWLAIYVALLIMGLMIW